MNLYSSRITMLQQKMLENHIDLYIVLSDDYHGSEYVDAFFKEREFLAGFTGSAGSVVITSTKAALWTDGRYFLQAEQELSGSGIELMKAGAPKVLTISEYVKKHAMEKKDSTPFVIGYDGRCVSMEFADRIANSMQGIAYEIVDEIDLIGEFWTDRPGFPCGPVWELDEAYAGESRCDKLQKIRQLMKKKAADHCLIASLDDIAWCLNLRGEDILYNPVFLSYLLIQDKKVYLFVNPDSLETNLKNRLRQEGIEIKPYGDLEAAITGLEGSIWIDPGRMNARLCGLLCKRGLTLIKESNPTEGLKAIKNETEQNNLREAHLMDGLALTRLLFFLRQLDLYKSKRKCNNSEDNGSFEKNKIQLLRILESSGWETTELSEEVLIHFSEMDVAKLLVLLRKKGEGFIEESFAPICAMGEHGAIIHYEATKKSDMELKDGLLLLDTGGQYLQGTTDVTRTISFGKITEEMKKGYTAVLKGNLRLGAAVFPKGVCGRNLDVLAREALWKMGLNYNHGTGHGVGYLLNVHEGPQAVRYGGGKSGEVALEPGMLTSNEPGLYVEQQFGIRLENMILCKRAMETEYGSFYSFETLTLVPFDRACILENMLETDEKNLLNEYHKRVYDCLKDFLSEEEQKWLSEETKPFV